MSAAIFLSYAREDAAAARRIAEALRAGGIEVWFDEAELRGGEAWDAKIRRQIMDCALFVPLISQHTDERSKGYFRLEWKLAVEQTYLFADGVPFIAPVVIDQTREDGAKVPPEFLKVQWTRLPSALPTPQLIDQIQHLLAQSAGGSSAQGPVKAPRPTTKVAGPSSGGGRWLGYAIAFVAGVAVCAVVLPRLQTRSTTSQAVQTAPKLSVPSASPRESPEKSVAVLAFENLSGDKDNEYFSDGISEELLNVLAKVPGLRVAARTSAFYFKGKQTPIGEVAKQLNVGYVVEGSVRKVGTQVRITAQLINATDGFHVWSDTFTRELRDIFALQDEIAGVIAQNLQLKVGDTGRKAPIVDTEAHRLVLQGRYYLDLRNEDAFNRAEVAFAGAVKIDPRFAEAHAGLASVSVIRAAYRQNDGLEGFEDTVPDLRRAHDAAARALELDPAQADAHAVLGYGLMLERNLSEAGQQIRRALELNPNSVIAHNWYGVLQRCLGRADLALLEFEKARELDPLLFINLVVYTMSLADAGRLNDALKVAELAATLRPDLFIPLRSEQARVFLLLGRKAEALKAARELRQNLEISPRWWSDAQAIWVLRQTGNGQEAEEFGRILLNRYPSTSYQRGFILAALGRFDEAIPFLEHSFSVATNVLYWAEYCAPYRDDPRFEQLMAKLGRSKEYRTARDAHARMMAERGGRRTDK